MLLSVAVLAGNRAQATPLGPERRQQTPAWAQQGRKVTSPISQIGRLRPAAASSFLEWLPLDYIDFEASHFFVFIQGRTLFRLKFLPGTLHSASSGRIVRPPRAEKGPWGLLIAAPSPLHHLLTPGLGPGPFDQPDGEELSQVL